VRRFLHSVALRDRQQRRLALGSDAYTMIHNALTERFAALEAQRDLAISSDFIAPSAN